jgi:hypothetical protein
MNVIYLRGRCFPTHEYVLPSTGAERDPDISIIFSLLDIALEFIFRS